MKFQINRPRARARSSIVTVWVIMLVTMATPISSHVKDKNSIFTARGEHNFLVQGEILVFHQYLYNKKQLFHSRLLNMR